MLTGGGKGCKGERLQVTTNLGPNGYLICLLDSRYSTLAGHAPLKMALQTPSFLPATSHPKFPLTRTMRKGDILPWSTRDWVPQSSSAIAILLVFCSAITSTVSLLQPTQHGLFPYRG